MERKTGIVVTVTASPKGGVGTWGHFCPDFLIERLKVIIWVSVCVLGMALNSLLKSGKASHGGNALR